MPFDINTAVPVEENTSGGFNISTAKQVDGGSAFAETLPDEVKDSPVSLTNRARLALKTPQEQDTFLRRDLGFGVVEQLPNGKFAVGTTLEDVTAVDPEGLFNDMLGDVTEFAVRDLPAIAGQIIGSTVGTATGGPLGTVAGGTLGAGAGEALKQLIAKGAGITQRDAEDIATESFVASAFGLAGEGLFQGLKITGRPLMKTIAKAISGADKLQGDEVVKMSFRNKIADSFNFVASVKKESTRDLFKLVDEGLSVDDIFSNKNLNPGRITDIVDDVIGQVKKTRKALGSAVGAEKKTVLESVGNRAVISTKDVAARLVDDLKGVGIISDNNVLLGKQNFSGAEFRTFMDSLKQLGVQDLKIGKQLKLPQKNITFQAADSLKNRIFGDAEKFNRAAKSGNAQGVTNRILNRVVGGEIDEATEQVVGNGLRDQMVAVAKQVGADDYVAANKEFSDFANLTKILRKKGLDVDDTIRTEQFLKSFEKRSPTLDGFFLELDKKLEKGFVQDLEAYNVAQGFSGTGANFLRLSTIAGLAGMTFAPSPEGKIAAGAGGLILGTPAGLRTLIKAGSKVGPLAKGLTSAVPKANQRQVAALLSQLTKRQLTKGQATSGNTSSVQQ